MKKICLLFCFIPFLAYAAPNWVHINATSVPDAILKQGMPKDIAAFEDTNESTCHDKTDEHKGFCIQGRQLIFDIKQQQPRVYQVCAVLHGGVDFVAQCMISWVKDKHWMSSSKLNSTQNLVMRGCLKQYGDSGAKAVDRCFVERAGPL